MSGQEVTQYHFCGEVTPEPREFVLWQFFYLPVSESLCGEVPPFFLKQTDEIHSAGPLDVS